jgi:lipoate-protein ligase A
VDVLALRRCDEARDTSAGLLRGDEDGGGSGIPRYGAQLGRRGCGGERGIISFSLTFPVEDLRHGLYERYAEGVDLVADALRRLGVEAEGGEVDGEFCPGAHSVRSGGPGGVKHAGLAQRVTRRAARLEALILVTHTGELARVLAGFYDALGLQFRAGSIGDLPSTVPRVIEALSAETRERYGGAVGRPEKGILEKARATRGRWRAFTETR